MMTIVHVAASRYFALTNETRSSGSEGDGSLSADRDSSLLRMTFA